MGKFDGILLITDFDGTLSHSETISPENCEAIRYFQRNGGLFTLASGRQPGWLYQHWRDYITPNTWLSSINGAVLSDFKGEQIIFDYPSGEALLDLADRLFAELPALRYVNHSLRDGIVRQDPGAPAPPELHKQVIYKSVFRVPSEYSDEYTCRFRQIVGEDWIVMRSWINGIEVQRKGTGKGDTVRRLKQLLGEAARIVVGAGNYENDIDLIREADIGYAVGDSLGSVKEVADRITVDCKDHAIAAIIAELEREIDAGGVVVPAKEGKACK